MVKPPLMPSSEVLPLVMADLEFRRDIGIKEYGRPLSTHNGRNALQDAYEEALDKVMYLRQELMERRDFRWAMNVMMGALVFYGEGNNDQGEQAKMALIAVFGDDNEDTDNNAN